MHALDWLDKSTDPLRVHQGVHAVLTEFTKTKISFMLALLGMLFALHPVLSPFLETGYEYLGVFVKVFYAYTLTACLLSLGVYFYGVALMTEQPHSWLERLGNSSYA